MKKMKKIFALLIAMVMVLGMSTSVFAASITINPGDDSTGTNTTSYEYYQLFHASIDGDKVSYYLTDGTDDSLRTLLDAVTVNGADLFTFTKSADGTRWNVTINKKADNTEYTDSDGEAIATALNTSAIKAAALAHNSFTQSEGSAKAENLEKGYYLVTSTLGSKLVLQTLNDVTIMTKNSYYTNTKTASKTNMNVGDIVIYTVKVNVPATAVVGDTVTVHDTLDSHLAIKADTIAAIIEGTETSVTLADGTKKAETETFAKKFTVTSDMLGKAVVITYNAELLSTAADSTGYVNDVFTDVPGYETTHVDVPVYTFDIDVDKNFQGVTGDDASKYSATFQLRTTADDESTAIAFITDTTGYVKADSDDTGSSVTLTVNGKDNINVRGLAAGTYYLVEMTTSDGYNLLTGPVTVTITDTTDLTATTITPSSTVSYQTPDSDGTTTGTVTIQNNSGSVLPSTGGIGTTIFYIIGAILVIGAGVVLVTRRRMNSK